MVRKLDGRQHVEFRRFGRSAGLLSGGIGLAGLITYLYFAIASHQLDADAYGEIVVLWSATFVAVSMLYRPVEQLLSRTIAEREASGVYAGGAVRIAALIQGVITLVWLLLAVLLREPLEDGLLSGSSTLYWILVAAIAGYAANFLSRGFLAGRREFGLLSLLLLLEAGTRVFLAVLVAIGLGSGQTTLAIGVLLGPYVSLLVVPIALKKRPRVRSPGAQPRGRGELTLRHGSDFAASVFLIMAAEQVLLNGGPLLVQVSSGAAAAGFIFNVLMVARAPLLLFQGVAVSLLPHLTRLLSRAEEPSDVFAHSVRATLLLIAGFTVVACLTILAAGPELMQVAFGDEFEYDRAGLLLVGFAIGPYLAATTLNQAALAKGQVRRAAACWVAAATLFIGWYLLGALDELRRVEIGFAVSAVALALMMYALYRVPGGRSEDVVRPGSPAEVEARLAAAEEAV